LLNLGIVAVMGPILERTWGDAVFIKFLVRLLPYPLVAHCFMRYLRTYGLVLGRPAHLFVCVR